MNQAWFTTSQLCARLQMSAKEIKTMRERHGLPYMCAGKGYRYPVAGVIEWESERTFASRPSEITAHTRGQAALVAVARLVGRLNGRTVETYFALVSPAST